jgi:hypothetical protein
MGSGNASVFLTLMKSNAASRPESARCRSDIHGLDFDLGSLDSDSPKERHVGLRQLINNFLLHGFKKLQRSWSQLRHIKWIFGVPCKQCLRIMSEQHNGLMFWLMLDIYPGERIGQIFPHLILQGRN